MCGVAQVDAAQTQRAVAVLPFDNLSSDPELQYFSDGVSEEIIRRLSRGANIAVIGRASSFKFRAERKGEAARSLGCSHVLDGSVRRAAGRVRIVAHLVEAAGTLRPDMEPPADLQYRPLATVLEGARLRADHA